MAYTLPVKIAVHELLLDTLIDDGAGTAVLRILAGSTTLADLEIDHVASAVDAGTGVLTLEPVAGGTTWIAGGTATLAQLLSRQGVVLLDALPVAAGVAPVSGQVTISSQSAVAGGHVDLLSLEIA